MGGIKEALQRFRESVSDAAYRVEMASMPVSAQIVGTSTKMNTGSVIGRTLIGDVIGGFGGAMLGAATAKDTDMTKFLVTYADGHKAMETVKDGSARFKELIAVLDK